MPVHTFLWHDYETFGNNPRRDRPAQFAAIRTDAQLNAVGKPVMWYCKPAPDFLPDPVACLITGITPQHCLMNGMPEHQFAQEIQALFCTPNTIGVGYNTIRFDDEVTRFLFWRNLIDPYAREWQNGCGRWDILDMIRAAYALRPEGIVWPQNEEHLTSFKLAALTHANGLSHDSAHDALSDVWATIEMARLIRDKQPKLFEFCFHLRKKERVLQEMNTPPFLHISSMFTVNQGCLALMWPLGFHPTNKNEMLAWNLADDPTELLTLNGHDPQMVEQVRMRLFTKTEALPEGVSRFPLKSIHINKSPVVIGNLKILSEEIIQRFAFDRERWQHHATIAQQATQTRGPALCALWQQVFARSSQDAAVDVDEALYQGFIDQQDRHTLNTLRTTTTEQFARWDTAGMAPCFKDSRLTELFFRYRARNFPHTLSIAEQQRWGQHRQTLLTQTTSHKRTLTQFSNEINALSTSVDAQGEVILTALHAYAKMIIPCQG